MACQLRNSFGCSAAGVELATMLEGATWQPQLSPVQRLSLYSTKCFLMRETTIDLSDGFIRCFSCELVDDDAVTSDSQFETSAAR